MTVAEVDGLLYLPGHSRERGAQRAAHSRPFPGWQASFRAMTDQAGAPGGTAEQPLVLPVQACRADRGEPAAGVARLPPADRDRGGPGKRLGGLGAPGRSRRNRSAAAPARAVPHPAARRRPRHPSAAAQLLAVRAAGRRLLPHQRQARGARAASQFVHTRLRPGDTVEAAAPRGTFILGGGDAPVLLISAGVGATPVLAMLHALANARSGRDVWWLHGARNGAEEPFAAESRSLLRALSHGHGHVCYSRPAAGDMQGRDYDTAGRLSAAVLSGLGLPRDADAYLCGPAEFMAEVSLRWSDLGVDGARVHTEIFGATPSITPGIAAADIRPPHLPPGTGGRRPAGRVRAQRPDGPLGWGLQHPARTGRSL